MKKVHSLKMVRDMFEVLADNEYSLLWDLVDDFEVNGHKVSVKDSTQSKQVIIDRGYYPIGGKTVIRDIDGVEYTNPLDFTMSKLEKKKEEERMDFKDGSIEAIREAIGMKVEEDAYIKEFQPSSDQYKKLQAAADLMKCFTKYDYRVENIYFDYGQKWMWTTIVCYTGESGILGSYQCLTPRDQENIVTASSPKALADAVDVVLHKKPYGSDKNDGEEEK